jgi:Protein of unknown function (DUF3224)
MSSGAETTFETTATFTIDLSPGDSLLVGTALFRFTKAWTGGLTGTSSGVMLSAGDPTSGNAGYVALENFDGSLDDRSGTFVLQQSGVMASSGSRLEYTIVPGSGTGQLAGLTGTVELAVTADTHTVTVRYLLTGAG